MHRDSGFQRGYMKRQGQSFLTWWPNQMWLSSGNNIASYANSQGALTLQDNVLSQPHHSPQHVLTLNCLFKPLSVAAFLSYFPAACPEQLSTHRRTVHKPGRALVKRLDTVKKAIHQPVVFFGRGVIRLGWGVSNAMVAIYQTTGLLRLRINGCSHHKQTNKTRGLMNTAGLPSGNRTGVEAKWWEKRHECCRQKVKPMTKAS